MSGEANVDRAMERYAAGDDSAFEEIYDVISPRLLGFARRRTGNDARAQDIVQQTFLQLHRACGDFRPGMRLRPWIMTIALNLGRDLLRRRGRRPEHVLEEEALPGIPVEEGPDQDVARRVRAALSGLPREQREVIELHWFEQLSFNEIATIVGASSGAVRVRAHRGYVALRRTLEERP